MSLPLMTALRLIVAAPLLSAVLSAQVLTAASAGERPDKLELLDLLRRGAFDQLDARIERYQQAYEASDGVKSAVTTAFYAFSIADPALAEPLDQWVATKPDSYAARTARGFYRQELGWAARGDHYAHETTGDAFAAMDAYFARATADYRAALEIRPRLGSAYARLINIAKGRGDGEVVIEALMRDGLSVAPGSFGIRTAYLTSLLPWWYGYRSSPEFSELLRGWSDGDGGFVELGSAVFFWLMGDRGRASSAEAIADYVEEIEQDVRRYPSLKALRGYREFAEAEILARAGEARKAEQFYDRALRFADNSWYLRRQAANYLYLNRVDAALANLNYALERAPQNIGALNMRGRAHHRLKKDDLALADWNLALRLDPTNAWILGQKADVLRDRGRHGEALAALDRAVQHRKNIAWVHNLRGKVHLYDLKDPAKAIEDLRLAMQLRPHRNEYLYDYGHALYRLEDCAALGLLTQYRVRCDQSRNCRLDNKAEAAEITERLRNAMGCAS